jgi:hypothetical protein
LHYHCTLSRPCFTRGARVFAPHLALFAPQAHAGGCRHSLLTIRRLSCAAPPPAQCDAPYVARGVCGLATRHAINSTQFTTTRAINTPSHQPRPHTRDYVARVVVPHTQTQHKHVPDTTQTHLCRRYNGIAASVSLSLSIHSPFHSYHASLHLLNFVSCTRDVVYSVSQPSSTRGCLPPTLFLIESRAYVRRPLVCYPFSSPYTTRQALSARKTPTTDVFCTSCCHCASRISLLSKPFRSPSSLACSATNDEFHAAPQPLHMHTHRRVPDRSYDRYHE